MSQWEYCMIEEFVQHTSAGRKGKKLSYAWVKRRIADLEGYQENELWSHKNPYIASAARPEMTLVEAHEVAQGVIWLYLARLGASGWELVHVIDDDDYNEFRVRYYFKRQRPDEPTVQVIDAKPKRTRKPKAGKTE
jgi:hypothetical protein